MWAWLKGYLDQKLIRPFRESKSPVGEVALGAMIGMFWALTPLVGLQMTLVSINWFVFRFVRLHFSLPIAVAMVWISNPITMGPLYYLFYLAGYYFFVFLGMDISQVSYAAFASRLGQSLALGGWDGSVDFVLYIIRDLGWPMLIGGFVVATPTSIVSYFVARRMVNAMRARRAHKEGLTLEEWEHRHVKLRDPVLEKKRLEELAEMSYHLHEPKAPSSRESVLSKLHKSHPLSVHGEPAWSLLEKEPSLVNGEHGLSQKSHESAVRVQPKKKRAVRKARSRKKISKKAAFTKKQSKKKASSKGAFSKKVSSGKRPQRGAEKKRSKKSATRRKLAKKGAPSNRKLSSQS